MVNARKARSGHRQVERYRGSGGFICLHASKTTPPPIIMPRLEEPSHPWTLASINHWASDEFPDAFKAANTATRHINFEALADGAEFHNIVSNALFKRPEVVDKVLHIGHASFQVPYFRTYVFLVSNANSPVHAALALDLENNKIVSTISRSEDQGQFCNDALQFP